MPFPHNRATPLALCAAIGCLMYLAACSFDSSRDPKPASAEQTTLDGLRDEPADPELDLLFDQLNTLHFSGRLPDVKVLWAEDLDRFDNGDYRLNGMTENASGSGWPSSDEAAAVERHRAELNDSILTYNAAVAANERDLATYNEAVQRYNLMLAYPDGLAEDRAKGLIR